MDDPSLSADVSEDLALAIRQGLDPKSPNILRFPDETLASLGLTPEGISYLRETAGSPPARKVGRKRRRNLILEMRMTHLPVVLQAESLTGEFFFLLELDRRADVLAAFDQPLTINVQIKDSIGRSTKTSYTADYLVVYKAKVCAIEIKADHKLDELVRDRSSDWMVDENGYHYLPASNYFEKLGIQHVVIPTSAFSSLRSDNLRHLNTIRGIVDTRKYRKERQGILQLLSDHTTMRMSDIIDCLDDEDETPILQLIDSEQIYVDLDSVTLSDPSSVWVSTDPKLAKAAQASCMYLSSMLNSGEINTQDVIDPRYHLSVASRVAIARGESEINEKGKKVCERTVRRYRKALADANGDPKYLVPKWSRCGNREMRIGYVHLQYLAECIHKGKSDQNDRSIDQCFQDYKEGFQGAKDRYGFFDERPIERTSFYTYWSKAEFCTDDAYAKGGRRLANAEAESFDPSKKTILATRPFAVAHIDHWKTDLHILVGYFKGRKITKRPWLTAMVDAYSGSVLAIWLSFADPSKKACTMVIRDCVRRHGRLPEIIIVDGGSDFKSAHFLVMLATLRVIRCERPPEDPRFGKEVERVFKEFRDRLVRGLPGFGISIERARAVSAAFKAHRNATLTLIDAFEVIEAYIFAGYNQHPKPGDVSTRLDLLDQGLRRNPHSGKLVEWDLKFMVATSIEAPSNNYKLWPGRGVHVNDIWFTSPRLAAYRGYKKDISVRIEPYADSIIYVCVDGKWLVCASTQVTLQSAMSERSLIAKSSERLELAALRQELVNDMNRCAAEIVNQKLGEIARRKSSKPVANIPKTEGGDGDAENLERNAPFNFDDIEPYENEG
jgi:putative transposase